MALFPSTPRLLLEFSVSPRVIDSTRVSAIFPVFSRAMPLLKFFQFFSPVIYACCLTLFLHPNRRKNVLPPLGLMTSRSHPRSHAYMNVLSTAPLALPVLPDINFSLYLIESCLTTPASQSASFHDSVSSPFSTNFPPSPIWIILSAWINNNRAALSYSSRGTNLLS